MKYFILLSLVSTLLLSNGDCKKNKNQPVYKGKLEIAGICMNYTIKVIEGDINKELIEKEWKDESSGLSHQNVFRLGNPCQFPASIKQGTEFNFIIDSSEQEPCMVCEAYYPTPSKSISIKVVEK